MARPIKVSVARLAHPLEVREIKAGTTLGVFLSDINIAYTASIRVNAKVEKESHKLKNGDIISIIGSVSGGLL